MSVSEVRPGKAGKAAVDEAVDRSESGPGSPQADISWHDLIQMKYTLIRAAVAMERAQVEQQRENLKVLTAIEKAQTLRAAINRQAQAATNLCVAKTVSAAWEETKDCYGLYYDEKSKAHLAMDKRLNQAVIDNWEESREVDSGYFEQNQKAIACIDRRILEGLAIHREAIAVYRGAIAKAELDLRLEIRVFSAQLWLACAGLLITFLACIGS